MEAVEVLLAGVLAKLWHAAGDELRPECVLFGGVVGPGLARSDRVRLHEAWTDSDSMAMLRFPCDSLMAFLACKSIHLSLEPFCQTFVTPPLPPPPGYLGRKLFVFNGLQ